MKNLSLLKTCVVILFCAATAIASSAQVFITLHSFGGPDGANPFAGLVQATDGNFYGTTTGGGAGYGTVFKITPQGALTVLHNFSGGDGYYPDGGLVQGSDGAFYGTTYWGGVSWDCTNPYKTGCGTVFRIDSQGNFSTLYRFNFSDGANPAGTLVQGTDGYFYGTTYWGGANCGAHGCGTVFKISRTGALTTLHTFYGEGGNPAAALLQADDGNFYGTTSGWYVGGATVFRMTPTGALTILHTFCSEPNCADGNKPFAALVPGTDGNFYATAASGGDYGNGTVFKITPSGTLTVLHSFAGPDGATPFSGLVRGADGNFYATASSGGASGDGTVFKITPQGALTVLHNFSGGDGYTPYGVLVQGSDGNLYGTTTRGGGSGTVFRLYPVPACSNCRIK